MKSHGEIIIVYVVVVVVVVSGVVPALDAMGDEYSGVKGWRNKQMRMHNETNSRT